MTALADVVRVRLHEAGDPQRAAGQQAYMKSSMPYAGVTVPELRRIVRAAAKEHPLPDEPRWRDVVLDLWRGARVREERYAASEIAGLPRYNQYATRVEAFPIYDEMVVTGAWWDHVDDTASHLIGPLLRAHPAEITPLMYAWSKDPDRWRRRTSIICQLGAKDQLDRDLLTSAILANVGDRDFFLRKAIGWALRDYARTAPDWIRSFVAEHEDELSPLSRKEATRHL